MQMQIFLHPRHIRISQSASVDVIEEIADTAVSLRYQLALIISAWFSYDSNNPEFATTYKHKEIDFLH